MRIIDRLLHLPLLLVSLILAVGSAVPTGPAMADRPGTPNPATLQNCPYNLSLKPRLCGSFVNTATEEVKFEIELLKNNHPESHAITCHGFAAQFGRCWMPTVKYKKTDRELGPRGVQIPLWFSLVDLEFNTQYCARFRARRVSDDMVSETWSGGSCVKTPGPPKPPDAPEFNVTFDGRQMVPNGPPMPAKIRVAYTSAGGAGDLNIAILEANGPASHKNEPPLFTAERSGDGAIGKTDEFPVSKPWLYVRVCAHNYSGDNCSFKVVSASAESVAAAPPGGKPIAVVGSRRPMMPEMNLPGRDYRSQALRGNDPEACQQICDNEAACKAWTFVRGGVQSDRAMCWLKNSVPVALRDPNTVSGVKAVTRAPIAYGFELPGKDYRQVAKVDFRKCQELCNDEAQCKAWSWVGMMCSLKNDVPPRVANQNAASGVKAGGPNPN